MFLVLIHEDFSVHVIFTCNKRGVLQCSELSDQLYLFAGELTEDEMLKIAIQMSMEEESTEQ